jgi:hypothetical protein
MARAAGFQFEAGHSALLAPPGASLMGEQVQEGISPAAGFVALAFRRNGR